MSAEARFLWLFSLINILVLFAFWGVNYVKNKRQARRVALREREKRES